jgi:hypothetical protein
VLPRAQRMRSNATARWLSATGSVFRKRISPRTSRRKGPNTWLAGIARHSYSEIFGSFRNTFTTYPSPRGQSAPVGATFASSPDVSLLMQPQRARANHSRWSPRGNGSPRQLSSASNRGVPFPSTVWKGSAARLTIFARRTNQGAGQGWGGPRRQSGPRTGGSQCHCLPATSSRCSFQGSSAWLNADHATYSIVRETT